MPVRMRVNVQLLKNGKVVDKKAMCFSVLSHTIGEALGCAKQEFNRRYKGDYNIRAANTQGREDILLVVEPKGSRPDTQGKTLSEFRQKKV